jgi:hypothetical protein
MATVLKKLQRAIIVALATYYNPYTLSLHEEMDANWPKSSSALIRLNHAKMLGSVTAKTLVNHVTNTKLQHHHPLARRSRQKKALGRATGGARLAGHVCLSLSRCIAPLTQDSSYRLAEYRVSLHPSIPTVFELLAAPVCLVALIGCSLRELPPGQPAGFNLQASTSATSASALAIPATILTTPMFIYFYTCISALKTSPTKRVRNSAHVIC